MTTLAPSLPPPLPPGFDPATYLELNPDVAAAGVPAAQHWLAHGQREGRVWRADPLPADFEPALYLALNPDLRRAGVDPALHYRTRGRREGRFYRGPDPRARPRRDPLVVFVHIGKTAGSSLNEVLYRELGPGIRHAETLEQDPWALAAQLAQSGWISGHLLPSQLRAMVSAHSDRPLRMFSMVRHPTDRIASAYNWLLVLLRRGPAELEGLKDDSRAAAEDVATADHSDPETVIRLLERHAAHFLNAQARALFGASGEAMTAAEMRQALAGFESIRPQTEIGRLAAEMTGGPPVPVPWVNTSAYPFDKAVFRHPEVVRFLDRANAADARLFALVCERSAAAPVAAEG